MYSGCGGKIRRVKRLAPYGAAGKFCPGIWFYAGYRSVVNISFLYGLWYNMQSKALHIKNALPAYAVNPHWGTAFLPGY